MSLRLTKQALKRILQASDVTTLSATDLVRLFQEEEPLAAFLPDGVLQLDPRTGDRILYNSSRAQRPHDNHLPAFHEPLEARSCTVCEGRTTGVIDVAPLSDGFTFINKNLYPCLFPETTHRPTAVTEARLRSAFGFHFLQWTSNHHERDWHNMPLEDLLIVLKRLAALEHHLLQLSSQWLPERPTDGYAGYVSIIKNYGRLVGGSLAHGHQQIVFSSVRPARVLDHIRFQQTREETFSRFLLRVNPRALILRDYGPAVLVVPYFMRRPYDMLLLLKNTTKRYIYDLCSAELTAVALGWHEAIAAIHRIMPTIGRELAYNVVCHNGPGAGLYFEFLPYTQETGGLEHLGLYVCQNNPARVAAHLRQEIRQQED